MCEETARKIVGEIIAQTKDDDRMAYIGKPVERDGRWVCAVYVDGPALLWGDSSFDALVVAVSAANQLLRRERV